MYLNEDEKKLISKEIENLEARSSAELVAVVTKRSASYKYVSSIIALCFVAFISIFLIFFTSISNFTLLQIQTLCIVALFLLFERFENTILFLLPKSYKRDVASIYANKQFENLGLNRTKTNQAIMFFVSLDEKYVEIITDKTISEKINNHYWEVIIDEFINDVKKDELSKGYLKAIKDCNKILIDNFPIEEDDENELSNEVIELR